MPGRERERDSPDSRSALVESKAGKRQKPAPSPLPAGTLVRLTRNGHYGNRVFHIQRSRSRQTCCVQPSEHRYCCGRKTEPGTGFTVFTFLPCSTNITFAIHLGVSVEARLHKSPSGNDWKELYKAAIFEDDSVKLVARIVEAERALADRAAELFGSNETPVREQQAMENAAYFLRLLRKTSGTPNTSYEPSSPPQISAQQLCG